MQWPSETSSTTTHGASSPQNGAHDNAAAPSGQSQNATNAPLSHGGHVGSSGQTERSPSYLELMRINGDLNLPTTTSTPRNTSSSMFANTRSHNSAAGCPSETCRQHPNSLARVKSLTDV